MATAEFRHIELYGGAMTVNLPSGFADVRYDYFKHLIGHFFRAAISPRHNNRLPFP